MKADSVISEVRRAKTAIAKEYDFDVLAMVRALRQIDEQDKDQKAVAKVPCISPNVVLEP